MSAFVSRVNFGLRQLNKKGGKCRQHGLLTQLCSMGGQGTVSMQPLVCTFVCSSQNASALSEEQAIHQPRPSVLIYISMGEGQTSQCLSLSADGYKPRRSIIFASWSAGEYGAVGATEWLEVLFL